MLINDNNYLSLIGDGKTVDFNGPRALACQPRKSTYGALAGVTAVEEKIELIPRSEWIDRIKYMDAEGLWLENLVRARGNDGSKDGNGVPCIDQNGLGYCHSYSTVEMAMIRRLKQGNKFVLLSAESIGGPITNWRNQGASMDEPIAQLRDVGACRQDFMDAPHSLKYNRWKAGWKEDCQNYKAEAWLDLSVPGKMFDAAATMCFLGHPFAAGFGWWAHAICGGFRVLYLGRKGNRDAFALRYRNNWGYSFGDDGFLDMEEGKGTPDIGAFAAMHMTAYDEILAAAA